jgi:hypothetical protein
MGIQINEHTFYRVHDLSKLTSLSVRRLGDAIRRGELRAVQRGTTRFVRGSWAIDWLSDDATHSKEKGGRAT